MSEDTPDAVAARTAARTVNAIVEGLKSGPFTGIYCLVGLTTPEGTMRVSVLAAGLTHDITKQLAEKCSKSAGDYITMGDPEIPLPQKGETN